MTRRALLASFTALPLLRSLDLVKVTETYGGRAFVRYEPRAVSDARLRRIRAWEKQMGFIRL